VKKALAILFSLSLVWAQLAFSRPAPTVTAQATGCSCCDCGGTGCCLSDPSSPDSTPLPAPLIRTGFERGGLFSATTSLAWPLPVMDAEESSPFAVGLLKFAVVPLFTQHCALLI